MLVRARVRQEMEGQSLALEREPRV
jgi:hypothetical protein